MLLSTVKFCIADCSQFISLIPFIGEHTGKIIHLMKRNFAIDFIGFYNILTVINITPITHTLSDFYILHS